MSTVAPRQETYLVADPDGAAQVYDFLRAHEAAGKGRPEPRYLLVGSTPGDQVEIPEEVHRVLRQVVEAMRHGLAVTVAPQSRSLTTQQAAELLGLSRPTLVKLLESGRLPFEKAGTHRRIALGDLLAYREKRRSEQYAALEATSYDPDEDDLDSTLEQLREARRVVAARRRARDAK